MSVSFANMLDPFLLDHFPVVFTVSETHIVLK